jgi:hypothetical protein
MTVRFEIELKADEKNRYTRCKWKRNYQRLAARESSFLTHPTTIIEMVRRRRSRRRSCFSTASKPSETLINAKWIFVYKNVIKTELKIASLI